jgi:elongation factor Tu
MAERTVRDYLDACGYDIESAPVIKGSVLKTLEGDEKWEAELVNFAVKSDAMVSAPPE